MALHKQNSVQISGAPQASSAVVRDERETLPAADVAPRAARTIEQQIEAVIQRREAHQQPIFPMHKSLINTTPPALACEFMENVRKSRYSAWGMGPTTGLMELRQEIASWRRNLYGSRITAENVLITPGASAAFFLTLSTLVDPGQNIIMMPPCFPNYLGAAQTRGARVTKVPLLPENNYEPGMKQLSNAWTPGTRLAVCTLPNNPTATTLDNACVAKIEKLAQTRDARLVIDETFAAFDLRPEISALKNLSLKTTITLGSFSEAFSLADMRVGYLIASQETIRAMAEKQGYITAGASARDQEIAHAALRERESHFLRLIPKLRKRDADLQDTLAKVPGIEAVVGYAGPFKWIKTAATDSARLALDLVRETGIVVRPGIDYGQEGWVRIAFGMISSEHAFKEALQRLRSFKGWQEAPWDADIKLPAHTLAASTAESRASI